GQFVEGQRFRRGTGEYIQELAALDVAKPGGIERAARLRAKEAEITAAFCLRWNGCADRFTFTKTKTFVVAEEKCLVVLDRAADRSAELVAFQRLHAGGKEAFCVHRVVPRKFPGGAVKRIRARARNDVRRRARAVPELGAGSVREDVKLRDGID